MRTRSPGSICGVIRVVELFPVRCFPDTDADPATLPGGNWLASHQRSATLHRRLARWSLFGNVESPSLQFLCQLRFLSDTGCLVTGALASVCWILCNLFLWEESSFQPHCRSRRWQSMNWQVIDQVALKYISQAKNAFFIRLISLEFEMDSRSVLHHHYQKCSAPQISNTWLFWCISQLAADNPQSYKSSEVNGFMSCASVPTRTWLPPVAICQAAQNRVSRYLLGVLLFPSPWSGNTPLGGH